MSTRSISKNLNSNSSILQDRIKVAKKMLLLILAYFIQWWPIPVVTLYTFFDSSPLTTHGWVTIMLILSEVFSDLGGITNAAVYVAIVVSNKRVKPEVIEISKTTVTQL